MAVAVDSHSQNQQLSLFGEGRLALSKREAAKALGVSVDFLEHHVLHERVVVGGARTDQRCDDQLEVRRAVLAHESIDRAEGGRHRRQPLPSGLQAELVLDDRDEQPVVLELAAGRGLLDEQRRLLVGEGRGQPLQRVCGRLAWFGRSGGVRAPRGTVERSLCSRERLAIT